MATNYTDELKKGAETFGKTPSGNVGTNAFRAAYERLKAEQSNQRASTEQGYADAYQQMRGNSYQEGLGAAALNQGMSGGQSKVANAKLGAQQAMALGSLQTQGRAALRDIDTQGTANYSNALLEGQQAQQYTQQQEANAFERQNLITSVVRADGDYKDYTKAQRIELLKQLGISDAQASSMINSGAVATGMNAIVSDEQTANSLGLTARGQGATAGLPTSGSLLQDYSNVVTGAQNSRTSQAEARINSTVSDPTAAQYALANFKSEGQAYYYMDEATGKTSRTYKLGWKKVIV